MKKTIVALLLLTVAAAAIVYLKRDDLRSARAKWRYPHIVLVTLDTLNVRFVGPYAENVDFTPTLDRFAAEGTLFEHAYTPVPITLPAHTTLLTGRAPADTGVMLNGDIVDEAVVTMAETLGARGYRTGAVVSLGVLKRDFNLAQGFEHFDDEHEHQRWYRTADEVVDAASSWLTEIGDQPFFLWAHFSDPHEPYVTVDAPPDTRLALDNEILGEWVLTRKETYEISFDLPPGRHQLTWTNLRAPRPDDRQYTTLILKLLDASALEPWISTGEVTDEDIWLQQPFTLSLDNPSPETARIELRFTGRVNDAPASEVHENYQAEVAFMDRHLDRLERVIEEIGVADDTLWIVVSDHGEGLYVHGILGHAAYAYEDLLRLALILRGPRIPRGRRIVGEPVLMQDIYPTLLDLLGLPASHAATGRSQTGCWTGSGCAGRDQWWAYGASFDLNRVKAVAGFRWPYKVLWQNDRRFAVHELRADPWEADNLAATFFGDGVEPPPEVAALARRVTEQTEELQRALDNRGIQRLDPQQTEMLKALGYLGNEQ